MIRKPPELRMRLRQAKSKFLVV